MTDQQPSFYISSVFVQKIDYNTVKLPFCYLTYVSASKVHCYTLPAFLPASYF